MFTGRFTFNTSSTSDGNGGTYNVPANWNSNKINNTIYKKTIVLLIKTIGLGDIIDFVTKWTGIKYFIIKITHMIFIPKDVPKNILLHLIYLEITFQNFFYNAYLPLFLDMFLNEYLVVNFVNN